MGGGAGQGAASWRQGGVGRYGGVEPGGLAGVSGAFPGGLSGSPVTLLLNT